MNLNKTPVIKIIKPGRELHRWAKIEKSKPFIARFECSECGCVFEGYYLALQIFTRPFGDEIAPATYCPNCRSYAREILRYEVESDTDSD